MPAYPSRSRYKGGGACLRGHRFVEPRTPTLREANMFDLTTSTDFYAMLVEDFDDFMSEPHSARRALHCAITAYHLREWVWRDWLENDELVKNALSVSDQASFNAWVNRSCVWFLAIRDLANGAKHLKRDKGFEAMRVTAPPFAFDQPTAGFGEGAWGGPIPYAENPPGIETSGKGICSLIMEKMPASIVGSPPHTCLKLSSGSGGTSSGCTDLRRAFRSANITSIKRLCDRC